jgi:hypothetical protein
MSLKFSVIEIPYTTIAKIRTGAGQYSAPYVVFKKPKGAVWWAVSNSLDSDKIELSVNDADEMISVPVYRYTIPMYGNASSTIFAAGVQAGTALGAVLRNQFSVSTLASLNLTLAVPTDLPTEEGEKKFVLLACLIKPADVV